MSNIAIDIVRQTYRKLLIDEEWSVRRDRGFTWWCGSLAQHMWADRQGIEMEGTTIYRIHCRTDVVDLFNGTDAQMAWLMTAAPISTMSGFIRDPERPSRLQLALAINVHDSLDPEWVASMLSVAALLQIHHASYSVGMAKVMEGDLKPAYSGHPQSGPRKVPDDLFFVPQTLFASAGEAPSRWGGEELKMFLQSQQRPPCVLATGDDTAITAEYPFPGPVPTSMMRISTREPHPLLGNGCLLTLQLPDGSRNTATMREALALNEREVRERTKHHFLGCWCAWQDSLAFCSFLPNILYAPGALMSLAAIPMWLRVQWVTETVYRYDMQSHFESAQQSKEDMLEMVERLFFGNR